MVVNSNARIRYGSSLIITFYRDSGELAYSRSPVFVPVRGKKKKKRKKKETKEIEKNTVRS